MKRWLFVMLAVWSLSPNGSRVLLDIELGEQS